MNDAEVNKQNETSTEYQANMQKTVRLFAEQQLRSRVSQEVWKKSNFTRKDYLHSNVFKR